MTAAHQELGAGVAVRVQAYDPVTGGSELLQSQPTTAYAWLAWDEQDPQVAHLHCYVPDNHRWVQRDISFDPADPPSERGRTLGFVIASMYFEGERPQAEVVAQPMVTPASIEAPSARRWMLSGALSLAAPQAASSAGALMMLQYRLSPLTYAGIGADFRVGTLGEAQASERFIGTGAAVGVRLWPRTGARWLGLDSLLGLEQLRVSHFSDDDPHPVPLDQWSLRADFLASGHWELSEATSLFLALGTNYRFGETEIYVRGHLKAHVPAWIGVARVGFGARF